MALIVFWLVDPVQAVNLFFENTYGRIFRMNTRAPCRLTRPQGCYNRAVGFLRELVDRALSPNRCALHPTARRAPYHVERWRNTRRHHHLKVDQSQLGRIQNKSRVHCISVRNMIPQHIVHSFLIRRMKSEPFHRDGYITLREQRALESLAR